MANLIYACWQGDDGGRLPSLVERTAERITPDDLRGRRPLLAEGPGECLCLTWPNRAVAVAGCSARLGATIGPAPDWHRPGTPEPDGSYAMVRSDPGTAEACCDEAGTRTLWYAFDSRRLLVSTSQRALVCLLQGLDWNPAAFAWFLSTGNLGPTDAWDRRIRRLPRGARLTLDRRRWALDLHTRPVRFAPRRMSGAEAADGLRGVLLEVFRNEALLPPTWVLPLSGGYDSRFILTALCRNGVRPRTVTWGMATSRNQRGNDACVAEQVARHFGLRNDYLVTETADAAPVELADAFLAAHGGTTDALFPYLDGLRLWSGFAREGMDGILRGDAGFGTRPRSERHHRFAMGLVLLQDFLEPAEAESVSDGRQELAEAFRRQPGESLQGYGDRLNHSHLVPVNLAALNDVKAPYLEIVNPLLAGSVLAFVRQMPDHLRALRVCYSRMVESMSPAIAFANLAADDSRNGFLGEQPFRDWIAGELDGDFCRRALPERLRLAWQGAACRHGATLTQSRSARAVLKRLLPGSWVRALQRALPPAPPSARDLAFRCALASRLERLLQADAGHLAGSDEHGQHLTVIQVAGDPGPEPVAQVPEPGPDLLSCPAGGEGQGDGAEGGSAENGKE